ncbi:hypothetical protein [Haloarchaeobius amylolyticus]|uniref:hypothetical protein n=1 Tax=Haloarchaeobius amylolyticus TaxID=1198296 RepID=UPI0022717BA5|nr:hypothetical protein [Haloarchaeobius amylolyticus]
MVEQVELRVWKKWEHTDNEEPDETYRLEEGELIIVDLGPERLFQWTLTGFPTHKKPYIEGWTYKRGWSKGPFELGISGKIAGIDSLVLEFHGFQ